MKTLAELREGDEIRYARRWFTIARIEPLDDLTTRLHLHDGGRLTVGSESTFTTRSTS